MVFCLTFLLSYLIGCATIVDRDGDGYSINTGDCDDGDATRSPNDEDGDGYSTCDGDCDDSNANKYPADLDGDGVGACSGDCNDEDPYTYTGALLWTIPPHA
jgi:hypothetical protein